jgi:GMP synthase (glutamine-hydrolysing)
MMVQDEASLPFLRWEKRIIHASIEEKVPILGIGLGAQLIASTFGSSIYHSRVKEIGWSSVFITPSGQVDSVLGYLPENATVFQWHSDGFELPGAGFALPHRSTLRTRRFESVKRSMDCSSISK